MARFLIATLPLTGHVGLGLPIARTLVSRGHDVRWYTGRRFRQDVEALHELGGPPWVMLSVSALSLSSRDTAPARLMLPPDSSPLGRLRNRALNAVIHRVVTREAAERHRPVHRHGAARNATQTDLEVR
jgi:UDP:flavonoid glycosyltransferase YjiC (YdhE family)